MGEGAIKTEVEMSNPSAQMQEHVVTRKGAWDPGLLCVRNGSILGVTGENAMAMISRNDKRCISVGCKVHAVLKKLQGR